MTVDPAVLSELGRLRARLHELTGSVLATADGMVVAHDAHDLEPDSLAALAAAHLALARRFAHAVKHGELRESVVQGAEGYITSYAAGPDALLTVVTTRAANLALVHLEARRAVGRLTELLKLDRRPATPGRRCPPGSRSPPRRHPHTAGPAHADGQPPTAVRYRQATG